MANIGLISCVSMKRNFDSKASDLYISPLFLGAQNFAQKRLDRYFILSAKYGLLLPDQIVAPYDTTLKGMPRSLRSQWATTVFNNLEGEITNSDKVVFLAGEAYREFLEELLRMRGIPFSTPLSKMSIGQQLQWYSSFQQNTKRIRDLDRLYSLLDRLRKGLNGGVMLQDATGKKDWPKRGVYFFFEEGEFRKTSPFDPRVVRVGTHAVSKGSNSTLWQRLLTHKGTGQGGGNHRGSIFRLHVGKSILAKESLEYPSWGLGQTATQEVRDSERSMEARVSDLIGKMQVLWLKITDEPSASSDRSFIEKNSIGLLSTYHYQIDTASKNWLGLSHPNKSIALSSLWNINHIEYDYDPRFLDIFERYVNITIGLEEPPIGSLVPIEWFQTRVKRNNQLNLFE